MKIKSIYIALFLLFQLSLFGQITVVNPSFEDSPGDATIPKGWMPCQDGTTPDILPGFWGEYGDPSHGDTYVGLITRENSTFESIGQRLSNSLQKNECYKFSIDLAHGQVYSGYNNPIKLRIWIGENICEKKQLIYESQLIKAQEWEKHAIELYPTFNASYIIFEAFYIESEFSYKGNIMIDNLTPIVLCGRA